MRALLGIKVLIAALDASHAHHPRGRSRMRTFGRWRSGEAGGS